MAYFKNSNKLSKSAKLAIAVSKRFASPKQELAIQTTAGILRDAVSVKGGHNKPRVPFKRKEDGTRGKKVPYGKARWGTLVVRGWKYPEVRYEQGPKVVKRAMKAEAYKSKINSKKWKAGIWYVNKIS